MILSHQDHAIGLYTFDFSRGQIDQDHHLATNQFFRVEMLRDCLLYTSDAADERSSVDLGGRRIIKKKITQKTKKKKEKTKTHT